MLDISQGAWKRSQKNVIYKIFNFIITFPQVFFIKFYQHKKQIVAPSQHIFPDSQPLSLHQPVVKFQDNYVYIMALNT